MNMLTSDPRMAQLLAQGMFSPAELTVEGNTRQYVMHYKMPATDQPEPLTTGRSVPSYKTAGRRG